MILETYRQFNCDICGKEVKLRAYPDGTYDYYFVFESCTAHNGPGGHSVFDGFMKRMQYFCPDCATKIQEFINSNKTKTLT